MRLQFLIAWRFLFRANRSLSLNIFTIISLLGITLSVTLFLLISTVINGFSQQLRDALLGFDAPLSIDVSHKNLELALSRLDQFKTANPQWQMTSQVSYQFDGLLQISLDVPTGVRVRSVDNQLIQETGVPFKIYWQNGFNEKQFYQHDSAILVGENLYERLTFLPGNEDKIDLLHPFADFGPSGEFEPNQKEFVIAGTFKTDFFEYDDNYVLMPQAAFFSLANQILSPVYLMIQTNDALSVGQIKTQWVKQFGMTEPVLKTWLEKNDNRIKAMNLDRQISFLILLLIILISSFNLAGVILIYGMNYARQVAILGTLGLKASAMRNVFMLIGFILGGIGATTGVALGAGFIYLIQSANITLPDVYAFAKIPIHMEVTTFALVLMITPLIAMLVSYLPARRIAKSTVIQVLQET